MTKLATRWYVYPHTVSANKRLVHASANDLACDIGELPVSFIDGRQDTVHVWEVRRQAIRGLRSDSSIRGQFTVCVREGNNRLREFDPPKCRRLAENKRVASRLIPQIH